MGITADSDRDLAEAVALSFRLDLQRLNRETEVRVRLLDCLTASLAHIEPDLDGLDAMFLPPAEVERQAEAREAAAETALLVSLRRFAGGAGAAIVDMRQA